MAHRAWQRHSHGSLDSLEVSTVETGATTEGAWYRRCVIPDCRVWAGPYPNDLEAIMDGLWHARCAHRVDGFMVTYDI